VDRIAFALAATGISRSAARLGPVAQLDRATVS
jgi:hypothetical protein